jgi:hypothetical protein
MLLQKRRRLPTQIGAGVNAKAVHLLRGDRSHAMKFGDGQHFDERRAHGGRHHELPFGLR